VTKREVPRFADECFTPTMSNAFKSNDATRSRELSRSKMNNGPDVTTANIVGF
jgi:hypothetical protein